jgi:hypothetical protein
MLGVSPGTIDNLRIAGELPSVKIRARRLFDVEDLRRYAQAMKGGDPRVYRPPDPFKNDAAPLAGRADVNNETSTIPQDESNAHPPTLSSGWPHAPGTFHSVAAVWIASPLTAFPVPATGPTIGPGASAAAGGPEGGAA